MRRRPLGRRTRLVCMSPIDGSPVQSPLSRSTPNTRQWRSDSWCKGDERPGSNRKSHCFIVCVLVSSMAFLIPSINTFKSFVWVKIVGVNQRWCDRVAGTQLHVSPVHSTVRVVGLTTICLLSEHKPIAPVQTLEFESGPWTIWRESVEEYLDIGYSVSGVAALEKTPSLGSIRYCSTGTGSRLQVFVNAVHVHRFVRGIL